MITAEKARRVSEFNKNFAVDQELKYFDDSVNSLSKEGKTSMDLFSYESYNHCFSPEALSKIVAAGYQVTQSEAEVEGIAGKKLPRYDIHISW